MKNIKKYFIITLLLILSIFFISCKKKNEDDYLKLNLDNLKAISLVEAKDDELNTILNQNGYKQIISSIYSKDMKLIEKQAIIFDVSSINRITSDTNLQEALKNRYKASFFNSKLIVMFYVDYECNIYDVYYNGCDIEIIITDVNKEKTYFQTFILELDFSSLSKEKISVPSNVIAPYLSTINVHTIDEAKVTCSQNLLSLETPTSIIKLNNKDVDSNTNNIFINSLQAITYVNTTYDTKEEPIISLSYDDITLNVYNNRYFDIVKDSAVTNAYLIKGSLLFVLPYLDEFKNPTEYTNKVLDFIYYFDQTSIFYPDILNYVIEFAKRSISFEYPEDFNTFSSIEKLQYIYDNIDKIDKEEKEYLKAFISVFKLMFNKEINYTINYTLSVANNDICGKDIPTNKKEVKENDLVDIKNYLSMIPQNRLLIGWANTLGTMLPISFSFDYYSDLNLVVKTVANDDYTIEGNTITSVNSNYEIVYLPLFDIEGNEITTISNELFKNNETIKEIYINGNITTIGEHAFDGCINLEKIVIGKKVTQIGDYAFANCPKLSNIILEEGLTSLGNYMFVNDTSIKTINIPASMIDLKDHVFEGCTSIETFNVSANNPKFYSACNNIMEGTTLYYGCKNSTIPDGTVFIREFAFYGVTGLEKIYIPSCVVHIDTSAFHNCSGLKEAYISQSVMWNAKNAFNTGTNTIINCEYYQKMNGWVAQWTTGTTVNWNVPQPTE